MLPDTLVSLGAYSFKKCISLKSITIPENVTDFSGNGSTGRVFEECTGLESAVVKCDSIPNTMFEKCTALKEVTIDDNVQNIGVRAFAYCSSLESVVVPDNVVKIGYEAFLQCENLKSVKLSSTLEEIGRDAFRECGALEDIVLPDTLVSLGASAFSKCISLKSITIPKNVTDFSGNGSTGRVFEECTGLESAVVKCDSIPNCMFEKCTALKEVTIYDNVQNIGVRAFAYCSSLESVAVPDNVVKIGYEAFLQCENLKSVKLSSTLEEIGRDAFRECGALEDIVLPDTLVSLGASAFSKCISLKSITIPENVTDFSGNGSSGRVFEECTGLEYAFVYNSVVPKMMFEDCENLQEVVLGRKTAVIEGRAFNKCVNLRTVRIEGDIESIDSDSFKNCNSLECISIPDEDSATSVLLIDNEIPYAADVTGIRDSDEKSLDMSVCDYHTSSGSVTAAGLLNMSLEYGFKPDASGKVSNMSVEIRLPSSAVVVDGTMTLDGKTVDYEKDKNGMLIIHVEEAVGTIRFAVSAGDAVYLATYARMNFEINGQAKSEIIGINNLAGDVFTLNVPGMTSKETVKVNGTVSPKKEVELYVDGKLAEKCMSSAAGMYSAVLNLPEAESGRIYKIEAKNSDEKTLVGYVKYDPEALELVRFDMYLAGKKYDLIELSGRSPVVNWNKAYVFSFNISFNDNSKLENVRVVSVKGSNETRTLNTVYDPVNDCFIAKGFEQYVPGTLTVEYDLKPDDSALEGSERQICGEYDIDSRINGYLSRLIFPSGNDSLFYFEEYETGVDQLPENVNSRAENGCPYYISSSEMWFYRNNGVFIGKEVYTPNIDGTYDVYRYGVGLFSEDSVPVKITEKPVIICADTDIDEILKNRFEEAGFGEYYELALKIKKLLEDRIPVESVGEGDDDKEGIKQYNKRRRSHIRYSVIITPEPPAITSANTDVSDITVTTVKTTQTTATTTAEETTEPSESVTTEETTKPQTTVSTTLTVSDSTSVTVTTSSVNASAKPSLSVRGIEDGRKKTLNENGGSCGIGKNGGYNVVGGYCSPCDVIVCFRFIIDPSGYVYDGVMSNKIKQAEARIYYKDSDSGKAVLWDAEEYDQHNPTYSDDTGYYAWDVPEGMWQVEVNKAGYETAYSEWLPVPPEQLEVHIGMISKDAPRVEIASACADYIDVRFSQYVDVSKVGEDTVQFEMGGKKIGFETEPLDAEVSPKNSLLILAKKFRFKTNEELSGRIDYTMCGIVNYSGKEMSSECSGSIMVEKEITEFEKSDTAYVAYTKTTDVIIKAFPADAAAGRKLLLTASDENFISIPESVTFNDEGEAVIPVKALLPGKTAIVCTVEGTLYEETVDIVSDIDIYSFEQLPMVTTTVTSTNSGTTDITETTASTETTVTTTGAELETVTDANGKVKVVSCDKTAVDVVIPEYVDEIEEGAFDGCESLISVTIENPDCIIADSPNAIPEDVVIKGHEDSTAQDYADKYDRDFEPLEVGYELGDVDMNGKINIFDAVMVAKYTVHALQLSDKQLELADFTQNEKIDIFDAVAIAKKTVESK